MPDLLRRQEVLGQQHREMLRHAEALLKAWQASFRRGSLPLHLARVSGESNTYLRWRSSEPALRGRRGELSEFVEILAQLPNAVCDSMLEFERRRVQLNYEFACAVYELARLDAVIRHRNNLAQLRNELKRGR